MRTMFNVNGRQGTNQFQRETKLFLSRVKGIVGGLSRVVSLSFFLVSDALAQRYSHESDYYGEGSGSGLGGFLVVMLVVVAVFWRKIWDFLQEIVPAIIAGLALMIAALAVLKFFGKDTLQFLFSNPIILGLLAIGWSVWVWREIKNK